MRRGLELLPLLTAGTPGLHPNHPVGQGPSQACTPGPKAWAGLPGRGWCRGGSGTCLQRIQRSPSAVSDLQPPSKCPWGLTSCPGYRHHLQEQGQAFPHRRLGAEAQRGHQAPVRDEAGAAGGLGYSPTVKTSTPRPLSTWPTVRASSWDLPSVTRTTTVAASGRGPAPGLRFCSSTWVRARPWEQWGHSAGPHADPAPSPRGHSSSHGPRALPTKASHPGPSKPGCPQGSDISSLPAEALCSLPRSSWGSWGSWGRGPCVGVWGRGADCAKETPLGAGPASSKATPMPTGGPSRASVYGRDCLLAADRTHILPEAKSCDSLFTQVGVGSAAPSPGPGLCTSLQVQEGRMEGGQLLGGAAGTDL